MRDFVQDRKKDLDLVLCTPAAGIVPTTGMTLAALAQAYAIELGEEERAVFAGLPAIHRAPVGTVLLALEAKACMTAHQRALPRLYDELNSSHLTVHGANDNAIAAGFAMVNAASTYLSPDLNKRNRATAPEWSSHDQPRDAELAIDKVRQLPRRSKPGAMGYDALSIVVVDCRNDGSEVGLVEAAPAPQPNDIYHYSAMIDRVSHLYTARFQEL